MTVQNVKSGIYAGLVKSANVFVSAMKDKVRQNNLPDTINNNISIGSPQEESNGISIEITIDTSEEAAPMAAAYEWGSGIHSERGEKKLYPIKAKNVSQPLHFFWENKGKWFKGVQLPYGHPGVAPRPYIQPSIESTADEISQILATEFKASILLGESRIEVIK
jgi:hypothetical protein